MCRQKGIISNLSILLKMDLVDDEEDEVTDIREQIFHNTVREHIVSFIREIRLL